MRKDVSDNHRDGGELRDLKRGEARLTVTADRVFLDLRPRVWGAGVAGYSVGVALMLPTGAFSLGFGVLMKSLPMIVFAVPVLLLWLNAVRAMVRLLTHWTRIEFLASGGAILTEHLPWRALSTQLSEAEVDTLRGSYDPWYLYAGRGLIICTMRWQGCIAFERDGVLKRVGGYVSLGAIHAIASPLREATGIRFPLDDGPRPAELMDPQLRQRSTVDVTVSPESIEASITGRPALRSLDQGTVWGIVIILVLFLGVSVVRPTWNTVLYAVLIALAIWAALYRGGSADNDLLRITASEVTLKRTRADGKTVSTRRLPTSRITSVRATGEAYQVRNIHAYEGDSSIAFDLDDFTTVYFTANDRLRDEQAKELAKQAGALLGLAPTR